MAHLWCRRDGEWEPVALDGGAFALSVSDSRLTPVSRDAAPDDEPRVLVRRAAGAGDDTWVLLARPDACVLVNGLPADLGLRVLADRDEIRWLPAPPLYFSTERLAAAMPFPAHGHGFCPRCKDPIAAGQPSVRCPGCGLWHHATEERPCWTYGEQCAACPQPTALDAGYRWTPEEV